MQTARVIVWEATGGWAAHLRRALGEMALGEASKWISECRTRQACEEMLDRWPASLVAVEVTADHFEDMLGWLADNGRRRPAARAVVFAAGGLREAEAALRESGALEIAFSPRHLQKVADVSCRHIARAASADLNLRERVMAELPWGR